MTLSDYLRLSHGFSDSQTLRLSLTLHYNGDCVKEVLNVEDIPTSSKRTDASDERVDTYM